jgi:hypothetical protein
MVTKENVYSTDHSRMISKWPLLVNIPTPDIIILDLSESISQFRSQVIGSGMSIDSFIENLVPYIVEESKAVAELERFVSNTYDTQLLANESKNKVSSMYEEEALRVKAESIALAVEMVGKEMIAAFKSYGLYHDGAACYQFTSMADWYSPVLSKSDIHFIPF